MHAVPVRVAAGFGQTLDAGGGVTMRFLSSLNVVLGSVSFYNLTNPALASAGTQLIDGTQHNFSASMGELAALAGLVASSPIARMSLNFEAWGDYQYGGNIYPNYASSATTWFDNVAVSALNGAGDCLFNWGERSYPAELSPSGASTRISAPYIYRYYTRSDSYVGISVFNDRLYYLGPGRILQDLGGLNAWLAAAGCQTSR